ncbi:MAG: undecaprenyl/decaprenyl-phosphate alpha-N-acetylglucosaminyl 1-phosphate transferase [Deltaproteobacteria bacterium]|nr:undecaprenyl/decaprenyl-phosphate alpha-N-acetylglucosaminyl 1-phosphate transferase [Deltaproteobacteria bacterium]
MILFLSFIISFLVSIALMPVVMKVCQLYNWVDFPNSRKIHLFPISRHGGVGIFLSSILLFPAVSYFTVLSKDYSFLLYGAVAAMLLGSVDDFFTLSPKRKLLGQLLLGLMTYGAGFHIEQVHFGFGTGLDLGYLSMPMTVLWIIVVMNALNMIDGMDGLASSYVVIVLFALGILAALEHNMPIAILCFLLVGAVLGFFLYNFHPAKIFMGDGGSMFLGYALAVMSIECLHAYTGSLIWLPLLFLSYPLLEFAISVFRRVTKEVRIHKQYNPIKLIGKAMSADGDHLHHRLLKAGCTQRKTNVILATYAMVSAGIGFLLIDMTFAVITAGVVFFVFISLVLVKFLNYEQFDQSQVKDAKSAYLLEKKLGRGSLIKKVG